MVLSSPCRRYAVDLVVCVALGCDMFDCVFPTRTAVSFLYLLGNRTRIHVSDSFQLCVMLTAALLFSQRFGSALVPWGSLQVKHKQYAKDFQPIDPDCQCPTCKK